MATRGGDDLALHNVTSSSSDHSVRTAESDCETKQRPAALWPTKVHRKREIQEFVEVLRQMTSLIILILLFYWGKGIYSLEHNGEARKAVWSKTFRWSKSKVTRFEDYENGTHETGYGGIGIPPQWRGGSGGSPPDPFLKIRSKIVGFEVGLLQE